MKSKKFDISEFCAEVHPDDGLPARKKNSHKRNKQNHKKKRFLGEVAKAIDVVLASCVFDSGLESLRLYTVEESITSSQITAVFCAAVSAEQLPECQQRLNMLRGLFKLEIARTINRKRTPELSVQVIPEKAVAD